MLERLIDLARIDFDPPHDHPSRWRVVIATVAALVVSLVSDVVVVAVAEAVLPWSKHYHHFQFSDYAKLTVVGVIIGCAAWPVTTRITSAPRWLFFRMALLVTLVLFLPDLYLLVKGQPPAAVGFLAVMHLPIAFVTYNLLVHIAPVHARRRTETAVATP